MTEELARTDWAHSDDMAFWKERVKEYADEVRASGKTKIRAIEVLDPERAARAMYLLQNGATYYRASKETGLSEIVIQRMSSHHIGALEQWRPDLVKRLTRLTFTAVAALEKKLDRILSNDDELDKVSVDKLAVTVGIINDKNLNLSGQATMRIEHTKTSGMEEFEAMKAEAARRVAEKKAGAIEAEIVHENTEVAEA